MSYSGKLIPDPEGLGRALLIPVTGGYDSTAALLKLVRSNVADIQPCYVRAAFIGHKARYEEAALQKIIPLLNECVSPIHLHGDERPKKIKPVDVVPLYSHNRSHVRLSQQIAWPFALATMYNPNKHYGIVLSNNADDRNMLYFDKMVQLFKTNVVIANCLLPNEEPLIFTPNLDNSKKQLVKRIPINIRRHCWTCEGIANAVGELDEPLFDEPKLRPLGHFELKEPCGTCMKCVELELAKGAF